jgi:hypothetical protein
MASPAIVGTPAETAISTAGTSHVVNLPSGATGNLLIAVMDKGSTSATVNALAGWNELLDEASANGLYIAWRTCDGTEGATTTFTLSANTRGAWAVYEISGHINPATQPPQIGTTATGTSVNPNPPSVSVTGGSKDILAIALFGMAGEQADDETLVTSFPTNYTLGQVEVTGGVAGTNLGGMLGAAARQVTTATEDPGTFTAIDNAAWRAQTVVIHPDPTIRVTITPATETDSASKLAYGQSAFQREVLSEPTLLAFWRQDNSVDLSGNGQTLSNVGAELSLVSGLIPGDSSQARDHVGDGGRYQTAPDFDVGDTFSIEWIGQIDTLPAAGQYRCIVSKQINGPQIAVDSAGALVLVEDGVGFVMNGADIPVVVDTTYHIVWDKNAATNTCFIDKVDRTGTITNQTMTNNASPWKLGNNADNSQPWDGPFDELAIYSASLGATRVEAHYDAAFPAGAQDFDITAATETDAAQALTFTKTIFKTVTEATETDAAVALSVVKPIVKTITEALEADAAQGVTFSRGVTITPATETDAAQALTFVKTIFKTLTVAAETDEAQALVYVKPILVTLGATTETDEAVLISFTQEGGDVIEVTLIPADEADSAETLTMYKTLSVTPAEEADEAQAITLQKLVSLGVVTETDAAQVLAFTKTIFKTLAPASETDTALVLNIEGQDIVIVVRRGGPIVIGRF